jgi:hypothetical protein
MELLGKGEAVCAVENSALLQGRRRHPTFACQGLEFSLQPLLLFPHANQAALLWDGL